MTYLRLRMLPSAPGLSAPEFAIPSGGFRDDRPGVKSKG